MIVNLLHLSGENKGQLITEVRKNTQKNKWRSHRCQTVNYTRKLAAVARRQVNKHCYMKWVLFQWARGDKAKTPKEPVPQETKPSIIHGTFCATNRFHFSPLLVHLSNTGCNIVSSADSSAYCMDNTWSVVLSEDMVIN